MTYQLPVEERFWSKVATKGPDDCWEWGAGIGANGYGKFRLSDPRREAGAHRMAWALAKGAEVPEGLCVLHKCDNPPCCNPAHLFLGTKGDNNRDRAEKGRTRSWNKAKTHCSKGHAYDSGNTYRFRTGRYCRACGRERQRQRRESSQ